MDQTRYVDVNIFVYWLGGHPEFGEIAYKIIKQIENSQSETYVTSSLTIYEALVIMAGLTGKNLKDKVFVGKIISALTNIKGLKIEPLQLADFKKSGDLMNNCKLDCEDSIHLATAMRTNAREIISNDKDFDNTPIKRTP